MPSLLSVNIGQAEKIPAKSFLTGIYKRPWAGPVMVGTAGLQGDAIIDRKHHGGRDQAVYIYFADDYEWWSVQLGQEILPGTFGENLTISGVTGQSVAVGDRFAIGPVLLEATSHRTPCITFAARMGDPGFARRFHRAGRSGAYCRVLSSGMLEAGAAIDYTPFAGARMTTTELMALEGKRDIPETVLKRALSAPLHYKMRDDFENRLARLF